MDLQQEPEIRQLFRQLSPNSTILDGQTAAQVLQHSLLGVDLLERIWNLSDVDRDGGLTENEFVVAFHLCVCVLKRGLVLPSKLPLKLQQIFTRPNKFVKGDLVEHFRESDGVVRHCTVVGVHLDDLVNGVYYTLKLSSNGNELQSQESKLNYVGIWQKRQQVVVKEDSDDHGDDDEFGDFTQASGAVAIAAAPRDDFLDLSFSGAPLPVAASTTTREDLFGDFTASSPPQHKDVSFGDFASFDFSPQQQQPAQMGVFLPPQQQHNDVSFGDFTSSYFPPPQQQQQPVQVGAFAPLKQQHNDALLFGDFGPSPSQQQAGAFGASSSPKQQQDISFGDFSSFLPPVPPQTEVASPVRRFLSAPVNEPNNNNQFMLRRADSSGNRLAAMSSFLSPIMPQPTSNTVPQAPAIVTTHFGQQAFDQDHHASFIASEASSSLSMQDTPLEEHPVIEADMASNEFDSSMQFTPATTVYDRRNLVQDVVVSVETMENEPMVVESGEEEVNLFDFSEPTSITPANDLTKDMEEYKPGVAQTAEADVIAPITVEPTEEDISHFSEPTVTRATKDKGETVASNAVKEEEPVPPVATKMTEQEEEIGFAEAIAERDSGPSPITKATEDDEFGFPETTALQEEASSPIGFPEATVSVVADEKENDAAEPIVSRAREDDEFGSPEDNAEQEETFSLATNVTEDEFGFPEATVSAVVDDKENNTAEPVATPPMAGDEFGFPSTEFAKPRNEEADTDVLPANKKTSEEDTLEFDFPEAEVAKAVEDDLSSTTNVMESDEFDFPEAVVQEKEDKEPESSPATNVVEEVKVDSSLKEKVSVDPANDLEFDFPETFAVAAAEAAKEDETVAVQSAAFEDPFDFFQVASSPMPTLSGNVPIVVKEEDTLQKEPPVQINEFVVVEENTSSNNNNNNASSNSSFEVISPPAIDEDFDFFQTAAPTTQDNDDDDFGDFQS